MPQLRTINAYQDERSPEPTGVQQFFSRLGKDYSDRKDKAEIDNIISGYQQNRQDENSLEDLFLNIEKSNAGPSKRLEATQRIKEGMGVVAQRDKAINQKISQVAKQDAEKEKREVREQNRKRNHEVIRNAGGTEQQADLYDVASIGGQTKVMGDILEDIARQKTPPGLLGEGLKDYDAGLTPKERVNRQDDRYKLQTPLIEKNNESLRGLEGEERSITFLEELDKTGKIGAGIHNLNINPTTGSLIIPALATKEEQAFVKTINDFTVKAKDSYGGRVTNFELDRFMMRLPGLANSKEGRELIMRQMKIINEINTLEKKALQDVFDQYGVRNIDYAEAENIARKRIEPQKEELRKKYLDFEKVARQHTEETDRKIRDKAPEGYVPMRSKEGKTQYFPEKNVPNLEDKKWKRV